MEYTCKFCKQLIKVEYPKIIHSGFDDTGFMYCDKCGDILTWDAYDPNYEAIVGDKLPWMLNDDEKIRVEKAVISCDCGGNFKFEAKPRCPKCNNEIPDILPDAIHFIILNNEINSRERNIWKATIGNGT